MHNFNDLYENIETTVYEGLLKLGYQNESFRIYYDLDLINYLLNMTFLTNSECLEYLNRYKENANIKFSNIDISLENKRFKFTVLIDGIQQIIEDNKNNEFLKDLISTVKDHDFTLKDIIKIFKHYSDDFICEEVNSDEFQYVLFFKDKTIDKFKYCFNFDEMGGYYHRLLDFSYEKSL